MENNSTYFKIGLFVTALGAALVAGLLYISADTINSHAFLVETYIDESVQGLDVGSPVIYRGVNIGHVKDITFVPREYVMEPETLEYQHFSRYVMVIMALNPEAFPGKYEEPQAFENMLRRQITAGLRFKLTYQGITGIAFMEADYVDPEREIPLSVPWVPKGIYVPSTPSLIRSFTQAFEDLFRRIENMDVESLLIKMETTLDTMDQAIKEAKVAEIRTSFISLTREIRQSNEKLQPFLEKSQTIPEDLKAAVRQFTRTMQCVETVLNEHDPDLNILLDDLKVLSENFKYLSESLKQDPGQILLSSPPQHSELVQ